MRGLIQKRGSESWRIRAYVGRDANGTKRYVSKTVRGTRKDAERDLTGCWSRSTRGATRPRRR